MRKLNNESITDEVKLLIRYAGEESQAGEFIANKKVLEISPNPAKSNIFVKFTGFEDRQQEDEVFSAFGETVFKAKHNPVKNATLEIDVSKFASGIYYLKFGNEIRKFIVG